MRNTSQPWVRGSWSQPRIQGSWSHHVFPNYHTVLKQFRNCTCTVLIEDRWWDEGDGEAEDTRRPRNALPCGASIALADVGSFSLPGATVSFFASSLFSPSPEENARKTSNFPRTTSGNSFRNNSFILPRSFLCAGIFLVETPPLSVERTQSASRWGCAPPLPLSAAGSISWPCHFFCDPQVRRRKIGQIYLCRKKFMGGFHEAS